MRMREAVFPRCWCSAGMGIAFSGVWLGPRFAWHVNVRGEAGEKLEGLEDEGLEWGVREWGRRGDGRYGRMDGGREVCGERCDVMMVHGMCFKNDYFVKMNIAGKLPKIAIKHTHHHILICSIHTIPCYAIPLNYLQLNKS